LTCRRSAPKITAKEISFPRHRTNHFAFPSSRKFVGWNRSFELVYIAGGAPIRIALPEGACPGGPVWPLMEAIRVFDFLSVLCGIPSRTLRLRVFDRNRETAKVAKKTAPQLGHGTTTREMTRIDLPLPRPLR
jgi:hypothetical protein